jgi:glycosyltransferase involved in cell wall biosynthesis
VGTVISRKGQMLLLRTVGRLLAQHPNLPVRLLLVGFADELHRHKTLSSLPQMERTAVLNGRLLWAQQQDISIFYKSADAFVMNSQGNGENFGRVTIEAMAYGLPILGTDAGGTKEIVVDGKTGLLHPVGEVGLETLRANILRLVNDRQYARQLGIAGRQRASECFSSRRFFRELEDALAPALSKSEEQCPHSRVRRTLH